MTKPIRMKGKMPKKKSNILVGTPIDDRKLYCWEEYVKSIKAISKVDEVVICDTSKNKLMRQRILDEGFIYISCWENKAMDRVVTARNLLRQYAIDHGYNWLLFIDADIICQDDIATKLTSHKAEVITGIGIILNGAIPIASAKFLKEGTYYAFPEDKIDGNVHIVDLIGLGCCAINKYVLNTIEFRCERDKDNKLTKSEDHCFSLDCNEKKIALLFDTSVSTQHKISGEGHWDFDIA